MCRRIVLFLLLAPMWAFAQPPAQESFKRLVQLGDEAMEQGDMQNAMDLYGRAMEIDSGEHVLTWRMAQANRLYKDYRKAEYYYQRLYDKESSRIYPTSLFWLASMQKMNGKYEESLENWKKVSKQFKKQRKSFEYLKAKQEIRSITWAMSALKQPPSMEFRYLDPPINTTHAEMPTAIINDSLYFTTLREADTGYLQPFYRDNLSLLLMRGGLDSLADVEMLEIPENLFDPGGGSLSADGKRFYFSAKKMNKDGSAGKRLVLVANLEGNKVTGVDELGDMINDRSSFNSMPMVATLGDKEFLFFVSDRDGSKGGLDIWYCTITGGQRYSKARNLGRTINSPGDEVTPYYDSEQGVLYFATDWHEGFGGYDIFRIVGEPGAFGEVENMGIPVNSSANDLYYVSHTGQQRGYFATNRVGVRYSKHPTCCNEIATVWVPEPEITDNPYESLEELNNALPVTLYFHNDRPNEDSWEDTTELSYMTTYDRYTARLDEYRKEYSKGLSGSKAENAIEDIENFFLTKVDKGVQDLKFFVDLLEKELESGRRIRLTIRGFASPLAPTAYNVHLTRRRITSMINYLSEYKDGLLLPYIKGNAENGGKLEFNQVPTGEYTAETFISDNPNDQKNSIYSRYAARERKIEIQSVTFLDDDSTQAEPWLVSDIQDLGPLTKGTEVTAHFVLENKGNGPLVITEMVSDCNCLKVDAPARTVEPGGKLPIDLTLDTSTLRGKVHHSVVIRSNGVESEKEIAVTAEIQ